MSDLTSIITPELVGQVLALIISVRTLLQRLDTDSKAQTAKLDRILNEQMTQRQELAAQGDELRRLTRWARRHERRDNRRFERISRLLGEREGRRAAVRGEPWPWYF